MTGISAGLAHSTEMTEGAAVKRRFRGTVLRCALPGILLAAVALVPYLNKAYTIDDPIYLLLQAKQAARAPLHPLHFTVRRRSKTQAFCWLGAITFPDLSLGLQYTLPRYVAAFWGIHACQLFKSHDWHEQGVW